MNEIEPRALTLRDYWRVVMRRKWLVIVALFATVTPAVALSIAQDPIYEASARMLLQSKPGESLFGSDAVQTASDRIVANEIQVLEGELVRLQVQQDLGLAEEPPEVSGTSGEKTDVVSVTVQSGDPDTAAALANAYVTAYTTVKRTQAVEGLTLAGTELQSKVSDLQEQIDAIDAQATSATADERVLLEAQRRQLVDTQSLFKERLDQIQVDSALTTGGAQLVQPAKAPTSPVEPNPVRTAALAIVIGLILGLGAAFLVDYLDDSIRTPNDLAQMPNPLAVMAVVPVDPPPDHRPLSISKPDDPAVESYRSLRTNVQFIGFERDTQVIEVTSALPGEGKTTTATNLAVVLSQTGATVVLVDADLRKPRVHEVFALDPTLGLTNNLVGEPIEMTLNEISATLSVIVAGPIPPNPSEMLSGKRMAALIAELKARFDYVVVDTAPSLPVSDAAALSRHVDGVLLVTQAGRTTLPQVQQALANLDQVSAPMLGIVLNRAKDRRSGGYEYGYGYGNYGGTAGK